MIKEIKFPCCVATSEIKDEETFKKILDLFVANGARVSDNSFSTKENWNWFGVDVTTEYYDCVSSYSMECEEDDVTIYTLEQLLDFLPKEEAPVAQVTTLLPVGTEVKNCWGSLHYE